MKVLVTGFEPFNNDLYNPSLDVLKNLHDVEKVFLPVSYIRARPLISYYINTIKPDIVICLGLAKSRTVISLEKKAKNLLNASICDNDMLKFTNQLIVNEGKNTYETLFDLDKLCKELSNEGFVTKISEDAGAFICNLVYYSALSIKPSSLFVHLPKDNRFEDGVMSIDEMTKCIELLIKKLKESRF